MSEPSPGTFKVHVALGQRGYDILIGERLLASAGQVIAPYLKRPKLAIVTDQNVARHHLEKFETMLQQSGITSTAIVLPPGEATKSFSALANLCDALLAAGIERDDCIVAFGGGVIGDLTGFAAAILRRGVNFIQIPTTLLAQVDSSVGGKTGVNSKHGKNLIGAFHQPVLVLADLDVLSTLPSRQRAAGYAEVAKYGLLGNARFFEWLEHNIASIMAGDSKATAHAVETSCTMKAEIVARDETETGDRALLNLGHTFGHALEAATGYSPALLHGEAIAIGMVQAFGFSAKLGHCDPKIAQRVASHLKKTGLPVHVSEIAATLPPPAALVDIMRQDKKASGGNLAFILSTGIGQAFLARNVDAAKVEEFLHEDLHHP